MVRKTETPKGGELTTNPGAIASAWQQGNLKNLLLNDAFQIEMGGIDDSFRGARLLIPKPGTRTRGEDSVCKIERG